MLPNTLPAWNRHPNPVFISSLPSGLDFLPRNDGIGAGEAGRDRSPRRQPIRTNFVLSSRAGGAPGVAGGGRGKARRRIPRDSPCRPQMKTGDSSSRSTAHALAATPAVPPIRNDSAKLAHMRLCRGNSGLSGSRARFRGRQNSGLPQVSPFVRRWSLLPPADAGSLNRIAAVPPADAHTH